MASMAVSSFHRAQQDGLCLRYPDPIPSSAELTYENVVLFLSRATSMAPNTPFTWGYIDKPLDGTIFLLYIPPNNPFPNDGIRYQDPEVKYTIPAAQREFEIEVYEAKHGFIPNSQDTNASRVRRRYRLVKGGNNTLVLVHYTRGPPTHIQMNQAVRNYPLLAVNEPPVYVAGEKVGTKVYPPGSQMHGNPGQGPMPPTNMGMGMNYSQQQAMLAQQHSNMESLERRRERERERERAAQRNDPAASRPPPQRVLEDEDSGDEVDQISTRALALSRYTRNHDWMNDVFNQAAFKNIAPEPKASPYSIFSQSEIDAKTAKLKAEIEQLQSNAAQRRAKKIREMQTTQEGGEMPTSAE